MKTPREELHDRIEGLCYNIQGKMDSPLSASKEINREVDAYVAALPAREPKFEWNTEDNTPGEYFCKVGNWGLMASGDGFWEVLHFKSTARAAGRNTNLEGAKSAAEAWARENILIQRF